MRFPSRQLKEADCVSEPVAFQSLCAKYRIVESQGERRLIVPQEHLFRFWLVLNPTQQAHGTPGSFQDLSEAIQSFSSQQPVFFRSFGVNAGNFCEVFNRLVFHGSLLGSAQRCVPVDCSASREGAAELKRSDV